MPIVADFSEAKNRPLPRKGYHEAVIHTAEVGQSKAGNRQINIQWKLDGEGDEDAGSIVFDQFMLETAGARRTGEIMANVFGLADKVETGEYDRDGRPEYTYNLHEFEADDLIGLRAQVRVDHWTTNTGNPAAQVKGVKPLGSSMAEALTKD